ncbi:MAG: hypothetical protein U5O15_10515 [Candidatus Krumholzibacteriota bacterium]|nr:hypothetical protein [Candidatus Krumholzibacteriota bacterium]
MSPGKTPIELKQLSRLFLSEEERGDSRKIAVPEAFIWVIGSEVSAMRSFLASGISASIARHDVNVTLVECGSGMPNAGYYFALEPEEYLSPILEEKVVIERTIYDSLRFVYAEHPYMLRPFNGGFVRDNTAHIVVEAFNFYPGTSRKNYLEEILRGSPFYSLKDESGSVVPFVIIILDYDRVVKDNDFLDLLSCIAPGAQLYASGRIPVKRTGRFDMEKLDLSSGIDYLFGKRLPPSGPFFSGFTNTLLQKIGGRWKEG